MHIIERAECPNENAERLVFDTNLLSVQFNMVYTSKLIWLKYLAHFIWITNSFCVYRILQMYLTDKAKSSFFKVKSIFYMFWSNFGVDCHLIYIHFICNYCTQIFHNRNTRNVYIAICRNILCYTLQIRFNECLKT